MAGTMWHAGCRQIGTLLAAFNALPMSRVVYMLNVMSTAVPEGKSLRHEVIEFTYLPGLDPKHSEWVNAMPHTSKKHPTKGPQCEEGRALGRTSSHAWEVAEWR